MAETVVVILAEEGRDIWCVVDVPTAENKLARWQRRVVVYGRETTA